MAKFDPIAYINEPRWQKVSLGLERTRLLLEKLGRPQDALRFVHVAGTNGKGSTCAYIERILREAGYRTGLFTSPFIHCFEERIRVCGRNISVEALGAVTLAVRDAACEVEAQLGEHPTEFELMCATALCHFAQERCDIVVLEVGLGGRLDSTNVIERPELCVVTPIALDHTAILGETIPEVAAEKAGILKSGAPVLSWPQKPEAMAVVEARAAELGCPVTVADFGKLEAGPLRLGEGQRPFRTFTYEGEAYRTGLLGCYQPANAVMALEAVRLLRQRGWAIPEDAERRGVERAQWPGRFEVVATGPLTIVDGGHNPQGAQALAESLAEVLQATGQKKAVLAMGVLADKDVRAMVRAVAPHAAGFVLYAPENPRALAADQLARIIAEEAPGVPVALAPDAAAALRQARAQAGPEGVAVAFGTLYAIADLMRGLD